MNKYILITLIFFSIVTCKAQEILPLKPLDDLDIEYIENNDVYLKDTGNLLNKFVGVWKTVSNGFQYEFVIEEFTDEKDYFDYKVDVLIVRYKILNGSQVIKNTLTLPSNSGLVIYGSYLKNTNKYYLDYAGDDSVCGQLGAIVITYLANGQLKLILLPDLILLPGEEDCPNGYTTHILPTSSIVLTKQ